MKKLIKILFVILGIILFLGALYFAWTYVRIQRGELVKWDNKWYTQKQLREKFPPQEYDAPAKNTPEEVYAKFRQALLDDDIEGALAQITEENREKYREVFEDKNNIDKIKKIPDVKEIKQVEQYGNFSNYSYYIGEEKEGIPNYIKFTKNKEGYWLIDFI